MHTLNGSWFAPVVKSRAAGMNLKSSPKFRRDRRARPDEKQTGS
jgi:hypothetical protein